MRINFLSPEKTLSFCCLRHQTALGLDEQKIKDRDLTKNASQGSINQQIFPLISERFLSELPEPPL
jgi:hypothetical protein